MPINIVLAWHDGEYIVIVFTLKRLARQQSEKRVLNKRSHTVPLCDRGPFGLTESFSGPVRSCRVSCSLTPFNWCHSDWTELVVTSRYLGCWFGALLGGGLYERVLRDHLTTTIKGYVVCCNGNPSQSILFANETYCAMYVRLYMVVSKWP